MRIFRNRDGLKVNTQGGRCGNRRINGTNAFWHSPSTGFGHLAFVIETQEKPKTIVESKNIWTLRDGISHSPYKGAMCK